MSTIHSEIPTVNYSEGGDVLAAAFAANVNVLLLGDPGVGKTAIAADAAKLLGLPLRTLIGSTCSPIDIGGALVTSSDASSVNRIPLSLIKSVCDAPGVLFLDEIDKAPLTVQAALLRIFHERIAGDTALHAETRVIAAANPPEHGGIDLSAPLTGRCLVLRFRPSEREVLDYTAKLGDDDSTLRRCARDYAITAEVAPELLQIDIPDDSIAGGKPWAAPRSIERAMRSWASCVDRELPEALAEKMIAGSIGNSTATAFFAVLKLRKDFPTIEEIVAEPASAHLPEARNKQIAALGLVASVADVNLWAAWIYAERLVPELSVAAAAQLLRRKDPAGDVAHKKAGMGARVKLASRIVRV